MKESKVDLKTIIETCRSCKALIPINEILEIAEGSFSILYNEGTILKKVEEKIGEHDWNVLITSIFATFFSSLYATAELSEDTDKAKEFGKKVGAAFVAFSEKEGGKA